MSNKKGPINRCMDYLVENALSKEEVDILNKWRNCEVNDSLILGAASEELRLCVELENTLHEFIQFSDDSRKLYMIEQSLQFFSKNFFKHSR